MRASAAERGTWSMSITARTFERVSRCIKSPVSPSDRSIAACAIPVSARPSAALGRALTGIAHAAIDLSDGLTGDLMHLLTRSNVRAVIDIDQVPRSAALARMPPDIQRRCALGGGDDYELCFKIG